MKYNLMTLLAGVIFSVILLSACSSPSPITTEAENAEKDGRTISNDMMMSWYPNTYKAGSPSYLERDFEAGADLVCDQILYEYKRDICSESKIHWRRAKVSPN